MPRRNSRGSFPIVWGKTRRDSSYSYARQTTADLHLAIGPMISRDSPAARIDCLLRPEMPVPDAPWSGRKAVLTSPCGGRARWQQADVAKAAGSGEPTIASSNCLLAVVIAGQRTSTAGLVIVGDLPAARIGLALQAQSTKLSWWRACGDASFGKCSCSALAIISNLPSIAVSAACKGGTFTANSSRKSKASPTAANR